MLETFIFNYKSYLFYCVLGKIIPCVIPIISDGIAWDNSGIKVCLGKTFMTKEKIVGKFKEKTLTTE